MYNGGDDVIAVKLVLSGNNEAYGDIVHRYKNVVFNVVYAIVKNYHTAEDITQETFIDGYIKLKSLEDPSKIGAWLVKMAKNKCYNHLTRSSARLDGELDDYIPDVRMSTPENFLIEQQERHGLRKAIQLLPDLYKTVTELYYFDNLSQNKIAERLNIPIGTVSRRLYDARVKLKKELGYMDNNNKLTVDKDFEKRVAEKVATIKEYYALHNYSFAGVENEFKGVFDETVSLINQLPESQEKHAAYADVYLVASWQDETHQDRALREAELGGKASIISNVTFSKYIEDDYISFIKKVDETIPRIQKMPDNPEKNNAIGELLFWRGTRNYLLAIENGETDRFYEAKADFTEAEKKLNKINSYYPNAISGLKAVELETNDIGQYTNISYGITGEGYRYENGKVIFANQPGISRSHPKFNRYSSLNYYISANFGGTFFDENLEIGGEIIQAGDNGTKNAGSTHTLISKNEKVTVLAGTFDNCMHIKLFANWFGETYNADVYYAKGIGLVKAEITFNDKVENYELNEYKINEGNVGSEYFPFAVGNLWKYVNTNLAPCYWQTVEYELINIHPQDDGAIYVNFAALRYLRMYGGKNFNENCDSEAWIEAADRVVTGAPDIKLFDDAIRYLKFAVRKNDSANASLFAVKALDYMEKCRVHKSKNYRFLPSRINSSSIVKKDDKLEYNEWGKYDVAPHRMGSRHEENKIFGMKPFRYLQTLAGTLYSEKWVDGYCDVINDVNVKAENVGAITVKAGTFENCIKVTFDLALSNNESYFGNSWQNTHYGTKIYYFAPNIGIVKHDCIWGDSLSSVCELTEYKSIATDGEYMPVYIGNWWVYDEMTLEAGYKAQIKYDIAAGMDNEFFMLYSQECLYLGTEEEYEEFKKSL